MGRSRFKFHEHHYPYFVSSTITNGIPLFSDPVIANIILNSLKFIQIQWSVRLYGYVIMENHIHCVIEAEEPSKVLKRVKSYTAKRIIQSLQERGRVRLLDQLQFAKKLHKNQSNYQVWEEGVHPKQIDSQETMEQILEYIHSNPIKAGFVDISTHWRYSSARNYIDRNGVIPVTLFSL